MTRTERIICLLSLGSWCVYKAYQSSHESMFWDWLILLIIGILALLIFTWIASHDPAYRQGLKLPTLPGVLFVLTIAGLFFLQNNKTKLQSGTVALDTQEISKDSLTVLDHAKADKALQAWLIQRSPLLHAEFRHTAVRTSHAFALKP